MNESSNDSMSFIGSGTDISQQLLTTYQVKDIVAREGNKTIKEIDLGEAVLLALTSNKNQIRFNINSHHGRPY